MHALRAFALTAAAAMLLPSTGRAGDAAAAGASKPDPVLLQVVDGGSRSAAEKARDQYRHPVEALTFWGLKPGMTILEIQPGTGWWTNILAPYAKRTGGKLYVTAADLANPELSASNRKARADFEARYAADPAIYGKIDFVNWGAKSAPLPKDSFDFILTARSVHNWMGTPGMLEKAFREFYDALKAGGILALEQHRANPGPQDPQAKNGYVTEQFVITTAEHAGFRLAAKSEINANPKDTKDYRFGVWTLPPSLRSSPEGSSAPDDPTFDHSKYLAIGESDRMVLKFVKKK